MTPDELEAALELAFEDCDRAAAPLTVEQKQLLRRSLGVGDARGRARNPLAQLSVVERQALLEFVHHCQQQGQGWKRVLLTDWLQGRASGSVQFLRDRYGLQWLEQVTPRHLAEYEDLLDNGPLVRLQIGDRIEVSNGLWEWVQDSGPCSREWFPCTVIGLPPDPDEETAPEAHTEALTANSPKPHTRCVVRFDSGAEYEIQGIYEWNRPNWRWLDP